MDFILSLHWVFPLIILLFWGIDLRITKSHLRKHCTIPLVGSSSVLLPRVILNLIFAGRAAHIIEKGYSEVSAELRSKYSLILTSIKFKNRAFQLVRGDGNIIILPKYLLDEISALPSTIASPNGALEHDLLGPYTGLDLILESRLHHSIVQRKLTPRLEALTSSLERELNVAFDAHFPICEDWTEFSPYQLLGRISARLSGRALVGTALCRDPIWLDIAFSYTESCTHCLGEPAGNL